MTHSASDPTPEWSYRIDVADIETKPQSFFLSANDDERKHLARRLGLESLDELSAKLNIMRDPSGHRITVDGNLKAKVVQRCVITDEPVDGWIEEDFEAFYADNSQTVSFVKAQQDRDSQKGHREVKMVDEDQDPEPIVDGFIEAGELVTQYLSLAINPYPHAEGAHFEYGDDNNKDRDASPSRQNPFEALKNWKAKR